MNKALIAGTFAATLLTSQLSLAQQSGYVGMQYNLYKVSANGIMDEL